MLEAEDAGSACQSNMLMLKSVFTEYQFCELRSTEEADLMKGTREDYTAI